MLLKIKSYLKAKNEVYNIANNLMGTLMASVKRRSTLLALAISLAALWAYQIHTRQAASNPDTAHTLPASKAQPSSWFGALPSAGQYPKKEVRASLAERIDKLIATASPDAAYDAFLLVSDCLFFQEHGQLAFYEFPNTREMSATEKQDETELCSGMTERIKTSRLDHLATAAKAGVPGAAIRFLLEGPFGDNSALQTRPDDPLVQEWKKLAASQLRAQANQGNLGSLDFAYAQYAYGSDAIAKDPALALTYALALRKIYDDLGVFKGGFSPYDDSRLTTLKAGMQPEQIAAAEAAAGEIKANFDARKKRGH